MKNSITKKNILTSICLFMMLIVISLVFAGCSLFGDGNKGNGNGDTTLSVSKAMDSTIAMWEQIKEDSKSAPVSQNVFSETLQNDASDLTLDNIYSADMTGVGQFLAFSMMSIGLYTAQTMSAKSSNYTLGDVFSGRGTVVEDIYEGLLANSGVYIDVKGSVDMKDNKLCGDFTMNLLETTEFNYYTKFEVVFDKKTYAITNFNLVLYDNDVEEAGEIVWYFTGVTYNDAKGKYILVGGKETTTAEEAFASKIKGYGETFNAKSATVTGKTFSNEITKGFKYGHDFSTNVFL